MKSIKIGNRLVGDNHPCFIVAEIGINHNGSIGQAKKLIDLAHFSGCDAVKFQKRTIDKVYTQEELKTPRESIFGNTNEDLKKGLEFSYKDYEIIDSYCKEKNILWFASCWDEESVDFIDQFNPPCYKIASASLTDLDLIEYTKAKGKPILLSTGMSTIEEIDTAVEVIKDTSYMLYHCTSTYPCDNQEVNLSVIQALKDRYDCPIGYSGHEKGIMPSIASVIMGACSVERHITTDRTIWGSDQAASLEPRGLMILVRDIRNVPIVIGNGIKEVFESEIPIKRKLRKKEPLKSSR
jgi:N-acetylneuraminate synthase